MLNNLFSIMNIISIMFLDLIYIVESVVIALVIVSLLSSVLSLLFLIILNVFTGENLFDSYNLIFKLLFLFFLFNVVYGVIFSILIEGAMLLPSSGFYPGCNCDYGSLLNGSFSMITVGGPAPTVNNNEEFLLPALAIFHSSESGLFCWPEGAFRWYINSPEGLFCWNEFNSTGTPTQVNSTDFSSLRTVPFACQSELRMDDGGNFYSSLGGCTWNYPEGSSVTSYQNVLQNIDKW